MPLKARGSRNYGTPCICTLTYLFQLVTYGNDRTEALSTMAKALDSYVIRGETSGITMTVLLCIQYNTVFLLLFVLMYVSPNTSELPQNQISSIDGILGIYSMS